MASENTSPTPASAEAVLTKESPADEVLEELLVEEVSIDGMCGVY